MNNAIRTKKGLIVLLIIVLVVTAAVIGLFVGYRLGVESWTSITIENSNSITSSHTTSIDLYAASNLYLAEQIDLGNVIYTINSASVVTSYQGLDGEVFADENSKFVMVDFKVFNNSNQSYDLSVIDNMSMYTQSGNTLALEEIWRYNGDTQEPDLTLPYYIGPTFGAVYQVPASETGNLYLVVYSADMSEVYKLAVN